MQPVVTVGLDGSPEGLAAAPWAADEDEKRRLTLRLLYSWPLLAPEPAHAFSEADIRLASPARAVVQAAEEAALPVVGRRAHRHGVAPRLGPIAHAAIHHGRCPVAVVPHG
ncbi:hypothetical protein [Streptomyces prasinus]|uniref:hypothetical protein n=1 Tax=Streptomyces prasinus TaxID=67345 RepID=UPI0033D8B89D